MSTRNLLNILLTIAILFTAAFVTPVSGALYVPPGLNPGDTFHLAFLTEGGRMPDSTAIADYDTFVQGEATTGSRTDTVTGWKVIGSTATTSAFAHITTSGFWTPASMQPIYNTNGEIIVSGDGVQSLWDGDLEALLRYDQDGDFISPVELSVFTGTNSDGTSHTLPMGGASVQRGKHFDLNGTGWLHDGGNTISGNLGSFYALSPLLTAVLPVPEPSTFAPAIIGLLSLTFAGWRRRRR